MANLYFKINFLRPGANLTPPSGAALALGKMNSLFGKYLYRGLSNSISLFIIFCAVSSGGGWYFYNQVYLPRENSFIENEKEIVKIKLEVEELKGKVAQQQAGQAERQNKINQLKALKNKNFRWREPLLALQRTTVDKLWLNYVEVKDSAAPVTVIVKGSTFNVGGEDRPLQAVSEFTNGLMSDPAWHQSFKLKDWSISTPDSKDKDEKSAGYLNFELTFERR